MIEIGIRIFWGQWGGEFEPEPVVSVGQVAGDIVPSAPELVREDQSWMIRIDETNAMYASYSKERCANSDGNLQLLICAIIPKGLRLASKKSPLDLLEDIRRRFDSYFTFNIQAPRPRDKKVRDVFTQLLKNYALEECPWYVFYMEGDKPASLCVESRAQLDALMRYNAYPALAHIEHLEIGFNCKTTVDVNTKGESNNNTKKSKWQWWWKREKPLKTTEPIQPKPQPQETPAPTTRQEAQVAKESMPIQHKGYQVLVNGEAQNVFLRWDDDEYSLRRESTEDYRYESLRFKLGELKSAPKRRVATLSGRTIAQLDEKNGCINCEMKPAERWLLKEIAFTSDSDVEARKFVKYNRDKVQIMIGSEPWTDDKIKPSVAKKAVEKNNIRIVPKEVEGYSFFLASANIAKDRLVVTIGAKNTVNKINERKSADIHREAIVNPKGVVKDLGKGNAVPTRKSVPNWVAEVKVWRFLHPVLFKAIIACVVLLAIVSVVLVNRANEERDNRLRREEWAAIELAAYQQCTTPDQCRQYLKDKPYGFYRDQVDSLLNIFVQDSIAEMKRDPEKAVYYKCLREDVIASYNACEDYLVEFVSGRYESQVVERKSKLQEEYEHKDLEKYNDCIDENSGWCKRNSACDNYLNNFKYGRYRDKVEALKSIITAELRKGQKQKLALLNQGDLNAFGDNSAGYLYGLDYFTAVWLLKGGRVYSSDELFFHDGNLMKIIRSQDGGFGIIQNYKKLSVGPLIFWIGEEQDKISTSVENTIGSFRNGKGFRFDGWYEVSMIYQNVSRYLELEVDDFNRRQEQAKWKLEQEMKKKKSLF